MSWKDIFFSAGGARGTRASVSQHFQHALRASEFASPAKRRIDAAFKTLCLRYDVIQKSQDQSITTWEAMPFGYLDNDFEAQRTIAEYVVYQEHPADADRELVERNLFEAAMHMLGAQDDIGKHARTNFRIMLPALQEKLLWTQWIEMKPLDFADTQITTPDGPSIGSTDRAEPNQEALTIASRIRQIALSLSGTETILKTPFMVGYVSGFPNHLEDMHELAGGVMRAMLFDSIWGVDEGIRLSARLDALTSVDSEQVRFGAGFGIPDGQRWFDTCNLPEGTDDSLTGLRQGISMGLADLSRSL